MLVRFGKGSGSSDILGIILWPGPPSNQAFSILVKLTVNAICEGVGFLWRCWFSKAWANTLLYGTLDRHQAGLVCPQVFLELPLAGAERLVWEWTALIPFPLPQLHTETLMWCRRALYCFKICLQLEKPWVGRGVTWEAGQTAWAELLLHLEAGSCPTLHSQRRAKERLRGSCISQKPPYSALMAFCAALQETSPLFFWNPGESERQSESNEITSLLCFPTIPSSLKMKIGIIKM